MSTSNNLIFNKLLDNIALLTNKFINRIDDNNIDLYETFNKIPNNDKFIYILIIFFIFIFFNKVNIQLKHLFSLLLSFFIIFFLFTRSKSDTNKFNKNKQLQLDFLNKLMFNDNNYLYSASDNMNIKPKIKISYLHLNPAIIQFFYNLRNYSQLNTSAYVNSLIHANNLIGLNKDANIGLNNIYQNYDVAYDEYIKSIQSFSHIIYNLPKSCDKYIEEKYNKSLNILQELLLNILKDIEKMCKLSNENNDINISSVPISIIRSNTIISPRNPNTNMHEFF